MFCFLSSKPAPLFTKIETSQISDLKKRFAGKQLPPTSAPSKKGTSVAAAAPATSQTVEVLQAAVDKQVKLMLYSQSQRYERNGLFTVF